MSFDSVWIHKAAYTYEGIPTIARRELLRASHFMPDPIFSCSVFFLPGSWNFTRVVNRYQGTQTQPTLRFLAAAWLGLRPSVSTAHTPDSRNDLLRRMLMKPRMSEGEGEAEG